MGSSSNATIVVTLKEDVDNGVFSLLLKGVILMAVDYGVARWVCMELKKSCSEYVNATYVGNRIIALCIMIPT